MRRRKFLTWIASLPIVSCFLPVAEVKSGNIVGVNKVQKDFASKLIETTPVVDPVGTKYYFEDDLGTTKSGASINMQIFIEKISE